MLALFGTEGQVTAWFCFSGFLKLGDGAWTGLLWVPMHPGTGPKALKGPRGTGAGQSEPADRVVQRGVYMEKETQTLFLGEKEASASRGAQARPCSLKSGKPPWMTHGDLPAIGISPSIISTSLH